MWPTSVCAHANRLTCAVVFASTLIATDARAQLGTLPGQAILPLAVIAPPNAVDIRFEAPSEFRAAMNAAGGVTVFAASAPNGPLFVRLPFLGPFPEPSTDTQVSYGWYFPGVPPGTYWLAVVLGVVTTTNIPDTAWTRVVVPGATACATAPGTGIVSRDIAGVTPDAVRLFLSTYGGCASSYIVQAGSSPGASNVLLLEQGGVVLSASSVPSGSYYVRVVGRNTFGTGRASAILPVAVPGCSAAVSSLEIDGLTYAVNGHDVTLSWTAPVAPPGGPVTFYEIGLLDGLRPDEPSPRILLPSTVPSYTASGVPSGTYTVTLHAGNRCGTWTTDGLRITVP